MAGGAASGGRGAGRDAGARPKPSLQARLADGRPILLDGATGTELEHRGVHTGLPLWSTHALIDAPATVAAIHRDYADAGAEILTANTFRTQRRVLARRPASETGGADADRTLTALAVELARTAADAAEHAIWIAGSAPTLEDCYRPDLVPSEAELREEHGRHADNLASAGVDLALVETMNTRREAVAAAEAAHACGLPLIVSFVSWQDGRLLSGERLDEALAAILPFEPLAVGVNCLPPSAVPPCLEALRACSRPFCVYANLGAPEDEMGFTRDEDRTPEEFADHARDWLAAGALLVGGCCGTTPLHIRAIAEALARS